METVYERTDRYIGQLLAHEDEALKATVDSITNNGLFNMSISPTQGKMLQVLARMCNARNILELGTFAGYSTIWLARTLPADGKLITLEFDSQHAAIARNNIDHAGVGKQVEIRTGKALDLLPELYREGVAPFDLIFIDADKPPYLEYFQWAIKLARPGSIIVADNVIRNGLVLDPLYADDKVQGVQRLNNYLSHCKEVTSIILQTVGTKEHDGMVIAVVN